MNQLFNNKIEYKTKSNYIILQKAKEESVQLAGFVNVTLNRMEGAQISCFNYAKEVDGTQIGFFNYAKEIKGVPVGFLSYVNNGYHKLEVSADEIFYSNLAFRTGVDAFHNIITAGIRPDF